MLPGRSNRKAESEAVGKIQGKSWRKLELATFIGSEIQKESSEIAAGRSKIR